MQQGQLISNEFVLQRVFSETPAGTVWRALELNVGRLVLLQVIPDTFVRRGNAMNRLQDHFRDIQNLSHPHLVIPERIVEPSSGPPVIVQRFVEGQKLSEYVTQWISAEGQFPFQLIFEVMRPIASALDAAAARHCVHRSLSPDNIVVSQTEGVQILGFGLSGLILEELEKRDEHPFRNRPELIRYQAPEQVKKETPTSAADQYALGMIIAETLLKGPVLEASNEQDFKNLVLEAELPIQTLPEQIRNALACALNKSPTGRFPNCLHFLDALAGLASIAPPVTAPPPTPAADSAILPPQVRETGPASAILPPSAASRITEPIVEPETTDTTFEQIAATAQTVSAKKIEQKIKREKQIRRMFYLWNIILLIACIVAVIVFWDHISLVGQQRLQGADVVAENTPSTDSSEPASKRTANTKRQEKRNRVKQVTEQDFDDSNGSDFQFDAGEALSDQIRFMGTSGAGTKILFLLDGSATMGQGPFSTWNHLQKELIHSFKDMTQTHRFQVLCFNETTQPLSIESGNQHWIQATAQARKQACDEMEKRTCSGKTDPVAALEKALEMGPDILFVLFEQRSTPLTSGQIAALYSRVKNTKLCVVEIGSSPQAKKQSSFKRLADECKGEYRWVDAKLHGISD